MKNSKIKKLEFELAYLTLLTESGLKPLSRWEKTLPEYQIQIIQSLGLHAAYVPRRTLNGTRLNETIFSKSRQWLDIYFDHYSQTFIEKSPESKRLEGYLFGYPPCCVESFIRNAYAPNDFHPDEQKLLFHWACPNCHMTPYLLPAYRAIHECCSNIFNDQKANDLKIGRTLRKSLAAVASFSFLAFTTSGCSWINPIEPPFKPNQHMIPLAENDDGDKDYIEDKYEKIIGLNALIPDTDKDGLIDGPDLAQELLKCYKELPDQSRLDGPYVEHYMMRGLETCNVCQETVNMGYAILINPLENLSIEAPYISLHHFLEHNSFSYDGNVHPNGRVNAALLNVVLKSDGTSHFLGSDPSPAEVQEIRDLARKVDGLPREVQSDRVYAIEHLTFGMEVCHACGQNFNMGHLEIVNPKNDLQMQMPIIAVHFMHCGSLKFEGDINTGSVNKAKLIEILTSE